ncbi:MAG TPA: PHB depolymerase family esterase [Ramlibacter sp.]|nr:PHB depolymerase family esterase [Ramlibacter sp.]
MRSDFLELMQQATRLTQAGDPRGAAAIIQAALRQGGGESSAPTSRPATPPPFLQGLVIDVDAREVRPEREAPIDADPLPDAPAPAARGAEFIAGSHAAAGSERSYRLFVPPGAGTRPLPMVVMLHGCTQTAEDFAAGTAMNELAREQGFFVLYPQQSAKANPQRCWNWFKHSHQKRGRGEPALLASMVREVTARHGIDPKRVYVAGLSAGGAMAAILGEAYPELFAAVGVHSGLAAGCAADLPGALAAMKGSTSKTRGAPASRMPTIVFHGDADSTVHPDNAQAVIAACAGADLTAEEESVSHKGRRRATRRVYRSAQGQVVAEHWVVHGASHAWSGGRASGSYTDARGPDASAEMLRFFWAQGSHTAR